MSTNTQPAAEKPSEGITSISVILARIMWTLLGPAGMGLAALIIVNRGNGWLTPLDAFYGVVVSLMLAGRYVELRSGQGITVTGEPATIRHFKRYAVVLVLTAALVWALANLIGNHLIG